MQRRCPINPGALNCLNNTDLDGDSDIWVSEGRKGSRWRDTLENSALEKIRKEKVER